MLTWWSRCECVCVCVNILTIPTTNRVCQDRDDFKKQKIGAKNVRFKQNCSSIEHADAE